MNGELLTASYERQPQKKIDLRYCRDPCISAVTIRITPILLRFSRCKAAASDPSHVIGLKYHLQGRGAGYGHRLARLHTVSVVFNLMPTGENHTDRPV